MNMKAMKDFLRSQTESGASVLTEEEGYELLKTTSIGTAQRRFISKDHWENWDWIDWAAEKCVLKIVSREILHKSEWGGVVVLDASKQVVQDAMCKMEERIGDTSWEGFLLMEMVEFKKSLGNEWLLSFRVTSDFGPVVALGPGGIYTEYLSQSFQSDHLVSVFSPALHRSESDVLSEIKKHALLPMVDGSLRNQKEEMDPAVLAKAVFELLTLGVELMDSGLKELEINPLVVSSGSLIALDALVKIGTLDTSIAPPRPLHKIGSLLQPKSIGLIGVSEKMNPGKIILLNMLECGFSKEAITIVKPGVDSLEGCLCVPSIKDLPYPVDLMVLSISAKQVPTVLNDLIVYRKAESIILIPGGMEEKSGTSNLVSEFKKHLVDSRLKDWKGPVINGGNCVGVRSVAGQYDTLFIPRHKIAPSSGTNKPLALISQSGAYLVSLLDRMTAMAPVYSISLGNQTDLTIADYLTYLKDDPRVQGFGIYCEGLKPGDGTRLLEAAIALRKQGKPVVFYHAGKTPEGATASASHTASVAGNYKVFSSLARQAGIWVTESLEDFEDLTFMTQSFLGLKPAGRKLGALSNAGFECVAIADQLGLFSLAEYGEETRETVKAQFIKCRIQDIVDINNPLDLTPIMSDEGYVDVMEAVLEDEHVDVGVFGIVPLTPALKTLLPSEAHHESIFDPKSIVQRTLALWDRMKKRKPFVVVVDGGQAYQPMVEELKKGGIPVFTKMDRAVRILNLFYGA